MIETADLIRAYLKTEQDRYRVLEEQGGDSFCTQKGDLNVFRGKVLVATLVFGESHITCRLMEGRRKIDLHHPKSLDLLMETLKCFEFITSKVFEGELDVLDVIEICDDDKAWPKVGDLSGTS